MKYYLKSLIVPEEPFRDDKLNIKHVIKQTL